MLLFSLEHTEMTEEFDKIQPTIQQQFNHLIKLHHEFSKFQPTMKQQQTHS